MIFIPHNQHKSFAASLLSYIFKDLSKRKHCSNKSFYLKNCKKHLCCITQRSQICSRTQEVIVLAVQLLSVFIVLLYCLSSILHKVLNPALFTWRATCLFIKPPLAWVTSSGLLIHFVCCDSQNACSTRQLGCVLSFLHPDTHFLLKLHVKSAWTCICLFRIPSIKKFFLPLQFKICVLLKCDIDMKNYAVLFENIVNCCIAENGCFDTSFNVLEILGFHKSFQ